MPRPTLFRSKRAPRPTHESPIATAATDDGAAGPPLISARSVAKAYRTGDVVVEALRGVDLDVAAGEFVVIMGPSGNGKTTLLNCCSGIDDIDDGRVEIDGLDIHGLSDRARTSHRVQRMGFVFQSFNLIPVLNAAENCELPLLAAGAKPREARRRAVELLNRVGLGDRARHRPAELSGGEQQRVAIARSLVSDPAVVWADEPNGNLDSRTAESVIELFEEVNAGGQTLVVVTHDASIGQRVDRVVTVGDGLITDVRRNDRARPPGMGADGPAEREPAVAGAAPGASGAPTEPSP
ncbi:MAG: ABC transporter ATP-binding protein, partial [Acidimicrobiales bacterium]